MVAKMSIDQALMKARSYIKKDQVAEAHKLYKAVLLAFPQNKRAQEGLMLLTRKKSGDVKGRLVYNGKTTRMWIRDKEKGSPTVFTESFFIRIKILWSC